MNFQPANRLPFDSIADANRRLANVWSRRGEKLVKKAIKERRREIREKLAKHFDNGTFRVGAPIITLTGTSSFAVLHAANEQYLEAVIYAALFAITSPISSQLIKWGIKDLGDFVKTLKTAKHEPFVHIIDNGQATEYSIT